jgi:pimeloyl-ACP methyl ester carboxylesterase
MQTDASEFVIVRDGKIEVRRVGRGQPLVFLHPGMGLFGAESFLTALSKHFQVISPSHPGFGLSELPDWMSTVDDLAYRYLDFLEELDLRDVILVGSSLGGWIASEIAVKSMDRIATLVLVDTLGIKIGSREERDIADIYGLPRKDLDSRRYSNLTAKPDIAALSDEQLTIVARNRESEALFGWAPYMHNPKLLGRLHRVSKPTLVLWGMNDGIVSQDYGRIFAAAIPNATFATLTDAAHYPYIEQPQVCAQRIHQFATSKIPQRIVV